MTQNCQAVDVKCCYLRGEAVVLIKGDLGSTINTFPLRGSPLSRETCSNYPLLCIRFSQLHTITVSTSQLSAPGLSLLSALQREQRKLEAPRAEDYTKQSA